MIEEQEDIRTRVKICGLTKLEHARYASGARADYLGFIFYRKSPRYIAPEEAAAIISWIEGPEPVGVFVDESIDDVNEIAQRSGLSLVQLHGSESPDYCRLINTPIIKAFRVDTDTSAHDLRQITAPYLDIVDFFLFDTYDEAAKGGTGRNFNWDTLVEAGIERPVFLAGGIHTGNVAQAIEHVNPYAIDVSSSLEESPGIKDFDKMEAFFEKMESIWENQPED